MIERLDVGDTSKYSATEASIHLARYLTAKMFVSEKRVLDVACGEGYGSHLMKIWGAKSVCGVDIDKIAVLKAGQMFDDENLTYLNANAEELPFEDNSFDVIVSFETIEHLETPEKFLAEVMRLIKPGGTILLSCPNDYYYYENAPIDNPFHKHKYHFSDFKKMSEECLGKATAYYLGFAADGFITIPIENSTFPEDQAAPDTMLELFRYRLSDNVAFLKQERLINHWNSNYYLGVWSSDFDAKAISAAIYPRETFLKPEDFDIDFYRDVRMRLKENGEKMSMEQENLKTENETLKSENQKLAEQITALTEKITEIEALMAENKRTFENQLKEKKSALAIENERLKMMLEFANKEIAVLYNTFPSKAAESEVRYIAVDESVESNLVSQLNYYKGECARYENSTCWKITKPLRIVMDFLKKLFR